MSCAFSLPNVLFATAAYNFSTSELTKVVQTRHVLCIFTSECAFRHSGVQFFNIRTYKSGPNTSCFVHFHFRMCLSPQGRALFNIWTYKSGPNTSCFVHFHFRMYLSPQGRAFFQHQNLQKWSEHVMFCTFLLPNVLFATAACNFSSVCWAPTSAPAVLTGLLFDWPDTWIIEKTQHFATSLTFRADVSSFF